MATSDRDAVVDGAARHTSASSSPRTTTRTATRSARSSRRTSRSSALGKDSVMVLGGASLLPDEYRFLELERARAAARRRRRTPTSRVLVAVDCAQENRVVATELLRPVDADRRTSTITTTTPASATSTSSSTTRRPPPRCSPTSSTTLGVALTPEIAEALYTAVVTDTGRFQYSNTTPKALRLAARLVEAGADVTKVFVEVYESTPFPKLKLLARALERATELADGRIVDLGAPSRGLRRGGGGGAVLGGHHRPPARRRRRRARRARARAARRRTGAAEGVAPVASRRRRRLGDRARLRRRRPQARGRLLHRPRDGRDHASHPRGVRLRERRPRSVLSDGRFRRASTPRV